MFANYPTAVGSGTAITLALLYAMNALIGIDSNVLSEPRVRGTLGFTRVPPPEDPPETTYDPRIREYFTPPAPAATITSNNSGMETGIDVPKPGPGALRNYKSPGILGIDGPLVALMHSRPVYPAAPLRNGLEGWVIVQFDVLADGTITNVAVVESSHPAFEKSALNAARKSRYKPRVVGGVPLATTDVQKIFRFHLQD